MDLDSYLEARRAAIANPNLYRTSNVAQNPFYRIQEEQRVVRALGQNPSVAAVANAHAYIQHDVNRLDALHDLWRRRAADPSYRAPRAQLPDVIGHTRANVKRFSDRLARETGSVGRRSIPRGPVPPLPEMPLRLPHPRELQKWAYPPAGSPWEISERQRNAAISRSMVSAMAMYPRMNWNAEIQRHEALYGTRYGFAEDNPLLPAPEAPLAIEQFAEENPVMAARMYPSAAARTFSEMSTGSLDYDEQNLSGSVADFSGDGEPSSKMSKP